MIAGNRRALSRARMNRHFSRLLSGTCVACLAIGPAMAQEEEETVLTLDGATQLQQLVVTAAGFEQLGGAKRLRYCADIDVSTHTPRYVGPRGKSLMSCIAGRL